MYPARPAFRSIALFLFFAGCSVGLSHAQARPTASRVAQVSVFGGWAPTQTDFGYHTKNGYMFGGDFGVFPARWWLSPALEFRYTHARNNPVTETSYLVGPRFQRDFGRFRPYGDVLFGVGKIDYHPVIVPGDAHDSGRNISYGGGLDIGLTHHVYLKLDFLQQNWNLGKDGNFANTGDYTLSPRNATVGVVYDFSYSNLHKQRELR
jgi:hypothetical protein